jgi:fructose 1,6-bisphosphatase|tara:strand:+ start:131 stop:397 length:267 start_codon:yes stop_codon:yes gene_type:complete
MGKKARNAGKKQSKTCSRPSVLEAKLLVKGNKDIFKDEDFDFHRETAHNFVEATRANGRFKERKNMTVTVENYVRTEALYRDLSANYI